MPIPSTLNPKRSQKGFTFIEVLVVIAIISIVAVYPISRYYSFQLRSKLNSTASEIVQTLRRAQSKAMAAEGGQPFGVHFEIDKFVLFEGLDYSAEDEDNEVFNVSSLEIYDISLGGGANVVFGELTGDTTNYGSVSIRTSAGDSPKTISINPEGTVSY